MSLASRLQDVSPFNPPLLHDLKRFAVTAFPQELIDMVDNNPNIYITSPVERYNRQNSSGHTPPSLSAVPSLQSLHGSLSTGPPSLTPNSSPTAADFPHHVQHHHHHTHPHTPTTDLPRHNFQHVSFSRGASPSPIDAYSIDPSEVGLRGNKRPRTAVDADEPMGSLSISSVHSSPNASHAPPHSAGSGGLSGVISASTLPATRKPSSRARSDSAPLGIGGYGGYSFNTGRPRSGSGLGLQQLGSMNGSGILPNIGGMRGHPGSHLVGQQSPSQLHHQHPAPDGGRNDGSDGSNMMPMMSSMNMSSLSNAPSPVR